MGTRPVLPGRTLDPTPSHEKPKRRFDVSRVHVDLPLGQPPRERPRVRRAQGAVVAAPTQRVEDEDSELAQSVIKACVRGLEGGCHGRPRPRGSPVASGAPTRQGPPRTPRTTPPPDPGDAAPTVGGGAPEGRAAALVVHTPLDPDGAYLR